MQRINMKDIEYQVDFLNKITKNPTESYTKDSKGKYRSNPGHYTTYCAYGAFGLHQIANENGGIHQIFSLGTKRELFQQINAFIAGIQTKGQK